DHQLGDAVAAGHTQRGLRVEVDQRNPDLATVAGIDGARRVDDGDPVLARQTRARVDEGRIADRQAIAMPVGTTRRSKGSSTKSIVEHRSAPASPACA